MAFLTTRMLSRQMICSGEHLFRRYLVTGVPEMPIVGTLEWNQILKNIAAYEAHPPLSTREISTIQRFAKLEKNISEIKEVMSRIMLSNQKTYTEVHRLLNLVTKK